VRVCVLYCATVGVTYETADNLAILPENDPTVVKAVASALGYDLDQRFTVEPVGDARYSFPCPCTVREALVEYFDLQVREWQIHPGDTVRNMMEGELLFVVCSRCSVGWYCYSVLCRVCCSCSCAAQCIGDRF
jgi:hypothetical protein